MRARMVLTLGVAMVVALACSSPRESTPTDSSAARSAARCDADGWMLSGDQVGPLRLGMPADSAMLACPSARDTIEHREGEKNRVLVAAIDSGALRIRIAGDAIHSIAVTSPRVRTRDSLGVGSPVTRLLSFADLAGGFGEGDFYVFSEGAACGLSFQLDDRTARTQMGVNNVSARTLRPFADSGRVVSVLVRGCRR